MQTVGLAYHELFALHDAGPDHPERPSRIQSVMNAIRNAEWHDEVIQVEACEAPVEAISRVHNIDYIESMRKLCESGGIYLASMESNVGPESYPAALRAAGAGMTLADGIMEGRWKTGFAPTRPPGHHATKDRPMGFCIFCNIAVTAKYIQQKYQVERIAIIDFDVHHGNGTEEAFWHDPSALYCSLHRANHFPYNKGRRKDSGEGDGEGYTVNVPLPAGCEDSQFNKAFDRYVVPVVEDFKPQFMLVSAGFDGHIRDMIGGMRYSGELFAIIAEKVMALTNEYADGKLITLLEGGYNIDGLVEGVEQYLGCIIANSG